MDNNPNIRKKFLSSALHQVLDDLLQHPEEEANDTEVAERLHNLGKTAVNDALRHLATTGFTDRTYRGRMALNRLRETPLTHYLKIVSNLLLIDSLVEQFKEVGSRIILFGSRASGTHTSESDIDLCVISNRVSEVQRLVRKSPLAEKLSLIIKRSEEWLSLAKDDPVLYTSLQKGIVLWEKK